MTAKNKFQTNLMGHYFKYNLIFKCTREKLGLMTVKRHHGILVHIPYNDDKENTGTQNVQNKT